MNINKLKIGFLFLFLSLFAFAIGQQPNQTQIVPAIKDKAYKSDHILALNPIPYPYLRESDVFWEKRVWRVIDFKEKMNQPLYFPEKPQGNRWRSLMEVLWREILSGKITAYGYKLETDNFEELIPTNVSELEKKLNKPTIVQSVDPNNPNQTISKEVINEFEPSSVVRLRIKEDWIFDKQRSEMQVRIIGICPMREDCDPTTGNCVYEPLFWLYFPEIRPILARAEAFNRENSARRLTYDQLFLQRRFSSTIIKEDNVYDRFIPDYASGMDALLEADRIKNSIRDFESELWVY